MLTIVAERGAQSIEIEFDPDDDFEVLRFQTLSVFDDLTDEFILVDFAGRELTTVNDLFELQSCLDVISTGSSGEATKLYVWIVEVTFSEASVSTCSSNLVDSHQREGEEAVGIIQPRYRVVDTPFDLCICCKRHISPTLLKTGNVGVVNLQSFLCKGKQANEFGLTLDSYQQQVPHNDDSSVGKFSSDSPVGKYHRRHYMQAAVDIQPLYSQGGVGSSAGAMSEGERQVEGRLRSGLKTVQVYEDFEQQRKARECIDFQKVCQRAEVIRRNSQTVLAEDVLCMKALLEWFKHDFFKWFKKPNCTTPGCPGMSAIANIHPCGGAAPTAEEQSRDWAGRVELYHCKDCNTTIRFPRINNPSRLLESRLGRCGEFANAFCLICRSLGIDANWVLDFTDHVWVEVYLPSLGRYVHADPCEKSLDAPMTYEAGWNKQLNYVFSFSRFGVTDVIYRYSRKFSSTVIQNRSLCSEKFVQNRVKFLDQQAQNWFSQRSWRNQPQGLASSGGVAAGGALTLRRFEIGSSAFSPSYYTSSNLSSDLLWTEIESRKRSQQRDLMMLMFLQSTQLRPEEMQGRISGDKEWKKARGEDGDAKGRDGNENSSRDVEALNWLIDGMIMASPRHDLEIFVSSVGNDDKLDNPSNCYHSDIALQHTHCIDDVSAAQGVMTAHRISVNKCPVLQKPGRGHNVVVLCAHTGAFKASRSFDTWGSDSAGNDMVTFLHPYLFPLSESKEIVNHREEMYVLIVTVLDSGENGGASLDGLMSSILHTGEGSANMGNQHVRAMPGHRESWLMVAHIGEQKLTQSSESEEKCKDCTGNLIDINNTLENAKGNSSISIQENVEDTKSSILSVRQVLHCSSSMRARGPTMAKVHVPLLLNAFPVELMTKIDFPGIDFLEVDMHVPSEAVRCVTSLAGESLDDFVERVKEISVCFSSLSGGFVIMYPEDSGAASTAMKADYAELRAFLFTSAGFPLRKLDPSFIPSQTNRKSKAFVKSTSSSSVGISERNREGRVSEYLKYVWLGGKHHPDTIGFDTTVGLSSMSSLSIGATPLSNIRLSDVRLHGDEIVESIRCQYFLDDGSSADAVNSDSLRPHSRLTTWSPLIGSSLPEEPLCSLSPARLDCITAVSIKYGDLVDSISIHYKSGRILKAGGQGGSTSERVDVNIAGGERVIGFFGGVGGHIHNFGVVLCNRGADSSTSNTVYSPPVKSAGAEVMNSLCDLAANHKLWANCVISLLQQHQIDCSSTDWQHPPSQAYNGSKLIGVITALLSKNDVAAIRKCIQTTLLYTINVIKNTDDPKFHVVKLSNKSFQNFILSLEGGLEFFLCSPVQWMVSYFEDCLKCCGYLVGISKNNAQFKAKWLESVTRYCSYLSDILRLDEFLVKPV